MDPLRIHHRNIYRKKNKLNSSLMLIQVNIFYDILFNFQLKNYANLLQKDFSLFIIYRISLFITKTTNKAFDKLFRNRK